ncbi:hypothetical protein ACIBCR_23200 [Micromonospora echinospora]|uniref:hypothetical protein n=1 Tax=Micromonospora echinospora TaxID=1877 RepID=UPI0037B358EB
MAPTSPDTPPGHRPYPIPAELPLGQRVAARLAVVALTGWAATDLLRATLAVGWYEARIVTVTHGHADVGLAWWAYELVDALLPSGLTVSVVVDRAWMLAAVVAATAFVGWLHQARGTARRLGSPFDGVVGAWWVGLLVAVGLHLLTRLHDALTSTDGAARGSAWDTRLVAYPLWGAGTAAAVIAAALCVRLIRRTAEDQQEAAEARGISEPA